MVRKCITVLSGFVSHYYDVSPFSKITKNRTRENIMKKQTKRSDSVILLDGLEPSSPEPKSGMIDRYTIGVRNTRFLI